MTTATTITANPSIDHLRTFSMKPASQCGSDIQSGAVSTLRRSRNHSGQLF
jgi:hypothetical protein